MTLDAAIAKTKTRLNLLLLIQAELDNEDKVDRICFIHSGGWLQDNQEACPCHNACEFCCWEMTNGNKEWPESY